MIQITGAREGPYGTMNHGIETERRALGRVLGELIQARLVK